MDLCFFVARHSLIIILFSLLFFFFLKNGENKLNYNSILYLKLVFTTTLIHECRETMEESPATTSLGDQSPNLQEISPKTKAAIMFTQLQKFCVHKKLLSHQTTASDE